MLAFVVQRLIQAIMVMVSVAFIAFLLFQYVGDPVLFMLGQDATADQIAALRKDLGLDQPFIVQFGHFLWNAVQGEFGISLRQGAKVSQLIANRFPATLELAVIAAGTWHHPLLALQAECDFLVVDRGGAASDHNCDEFALDGLDLWLAAALPA